MARTSVQVEQVAPIQPIALTMRGAAQYLSVAPRQIRTLLTSGELRAIRLGKRYVITVRALQEFIERKERES